MTMVNDHCQLIRTFNKIWANDRILPLVLESDRVVALPMKEPVDVELVAKNLAKEVKDLKATLRGIEGRLQVVEKQANTKKWKADSSAVAGPSSHKKTQHQLPQPTAQILPPPMASGRSSRKGKK